jgi:bifunctional non-homologous end joining protein LigD
MPSGGVLFCLHQQADRPKLSPVRPAFLRPCAPISAARPPAGKDWLHEPKWDGYRFQIVKNGLDVRLYSRSGAEYTDRLPYMRAAFASLPARAAVLDGELCVIDTSGRANFRELHAQMRTRGPGESRLMFMAFDLLHQDGVDLRSLPLSERKRDLDRLCRKGRVPLMRQVQTFPNGQLLFEHCAKFGFEGVVSKRLGQHYVSGPCKCSMKVKCPGWKRENSERSACSRAGGADRSVLHLRACTL